VEKEIRDLARAVGRGKEVFEEGRRLHPPEKRKLFKSSVLNKEKLGRQFCGMRRGPPGGVLGNSIFFFFFGEDTTQRIRKETIKRRETGGKDRRGLGKIQQKKERQYLQRIE